jgi:MFS transporter, OFA family, oxalate/formate antiporter
LIWLSKIKSSLHSVWLILAAAFFIHMAMYSTRHAFGVFFKSFEGEFDLTRAMTSSIFSLHMILCAVFSLLGGWALDKYGPRKLIALMGLLIAVGLTLTSQANEAWQLFITYSLILALATGSGHTVIMSTVSRAFGHNRGLALGIASSGGGLGTLLIAPLSAYLITQFGWRFASSIIGLFAGFIIMVWSPLLRNVSPAEIAPGKEAGLKPYSSHSTTGKTASEAYPYSYTFREAIRSTKFWFLGIAYLLQASAIYLVNTHIVAHAIDSGFPVIEAALILSIIGGCNVAGRLLVGFVSDTIGAKKGAIISSLIGTLALVLLTFSAEKGAFYVFGALFGLAWGGFGTATTVLVSRLFGLKSIGMILGSMNVGWHLGAAIGPAMGGLVFDATGSYFTAFIMGTAALLIAGLLTSMITTNSKRS